ncbi:MAG: hypothetical protein U9O82_06015 [Thermodesulfobacteriota bacterium]|nr:hypothetical protein [Thermodesulfobacteriota bacterium]
MKTKLDQIIKNIPEANKKNPTVIFLLELLEQQAETILLLKEQIQEVKDENSRLKKQKPKPKIKPSKLLKKPKKNSSSKRPGSAKKNKTDNLEIHEIKRIAPESIPPGSEFKGLSPYTVQGLRISIFNTRNRSEVPHILQTP